MILAFFLKIYLGKELAKPLGKNLIKCNLKCRWSPPTGRWRRRRSRKRWNTRTWPAMWVLLNKIKGQRSSLLLVGQIFFIALICTRFFNLSWCKIANAQGIEEILSQGPGWLGLRSSDDLCLLFCINRINPSSMVLKITLPITYRAS